MIKYFSINIFVTVRHHIRFKVYLFLNIIFKCNLICIAELSCVNQHWVYFFKSSTAINGYMYGNQPGLEMCKGDVISWHLMGLGSEVDVHGIYFSQNTFITKGTRKDTTNLFPHTFVMAIMKPDSEGKRPVWWWWFGYFFVCFQPISQTERYYTAIEIHCSASSDWHKNCYWPLPGKGSLATAEAL